MGHRSKSKVAKRVLTKPENSIPAQVANSVRNPVANSVPVINTPEVPKVLKPNGRKKTIAQPQDDEPLWQRKWAVFGMILAFRMANVFIIKTEFVPDESWQSTEVAYYYTYGNGHLTWEWLVGLRSYIYPMCIAGIYSFLKLIGADSPYMLLVAPRIFQGMFTAVGDYAFYLYCHKKHGDRSAMWSLGCVLTCWFSLYSGTRTLTNTMEMALNCIAMYLLDLEHMASFCGVVALNFAIRPTAVVIWIPQAFTILKHFFPAKVPHRIPKCLLTGLSTLVAAALLDWKIYGKPTLAWFRFIKFNFIEGKSAQFGEHHFLWYIYSAIPSIVGPNIVTLIGSLFARTHKSQWNIIIVFVACFSVIGHKEIRFLLPVLPYIFEVMGDSFAQAHEYLKDKMKERPTMMERNLDGMFTRTVVVCVISHFFTASYFCAFHQGGIKPSTEYINSASKGLANPEIWIMMSCYAVPVFTYLHNPNAHFEYITCGPRELNLEDKMPNFRRYTTNSSELKNFVTEKLDAGVSRPHFILCFEEITSKLLSVLNELMTGYEICYKHVHAQFGEDRGMVHVLCRPKSLFPDPHDSKRVVSENLDLM